MTLPVEPLLSIRWASSARLKLRGAFRGFYLNFEHLGKKRVESRDKRKGKR
jgi:hypothetical protein